MTSTREKPHAPKAAPVLRRKFIRRLPVPSVLDGLDGLLTATYGRVPLRRTLQRFGRPDRK